jgi:AcrR family transcriptional regulator
MLSRAFILQNRREQIARAHAELCVESGFRRTSIDRIVSRAETSRRTFYEVFSNRDDCFIFLISLASRDLLRVVDESGATGVGGAETIARAVSAVLCWMAENPVMASVLLVDAPTGPSQARRAQAEILDALAARLGDVVRGPGSPPQVLEQMLLGGAAAILRRLVVVGEIERAPKLTNDLTGILVRSC